MPFKAYYLSPKGDLKRDLAEKEIKAAFESRQGLLWVDIAETTEEDGKFLAQTFNFHNLAIEDCVSPLIHSPKIDDFGDYLFLTAHGINYAVESEIVEIAELEIFLGAHFVVSNHSVPLYSVEAIRQRVEDDGHHMKRGADFLAHALVDTMIDNVMPTIDKMSDIAEEIEEEVIRNPHQTTLEAVLKLKRSTLRIHRVMAPQREVLNRLSRGEFPIIKKEAQIFYRDIYDHLVRIEDLNQIIRDRADNALATYLSSMANRQNETMKVLSMVATIFLPLTLVAGIYGMNFEYLPELGWRWGYFAVLGLIGFVIAVAIWWFWARNWITWGRRRIVRIRPFAVEPKKLIGYIGHLAKRPSPKR
ncbi:MAG TPA: magnesium/cobalt transporter CorA [Dehalococcoidia bacterium]|nr:magnesium/cobalt transporter CorA [Dehalococcoidia bacterium]